MKDEANIYEDAPTYHQEDERALNVVERIKELDGYVPVMKDENLVEKHELDSKLNCTSITNCSTDEEIPTAKAVYQLFNSIQDGNEVSY